MCTDTCSCQRSRNVSEVEALSRRLSRNVRFRQQLDDWLRLPVEVHRRRAAELLAASQPPGRRMVIG